MARALRRCLAAAVLSCAAALAASQTPAAPGEPAAHVHAAGGAATWHPHRFHHAESEPEGLTLSVAASAPASAALLAPGGGKPRVGAAPPGVALDAALATAAKLQPELFGALPPAFLGDFKNPCWRKAPNATAPGAGAASGAGALRCLPYYFILGDFNCGVRDLHSRLLQARAAGGAGLHPEVVGAANSAPHWWDENKPWTPYLELFDSAAVRIETDPAHLVVGDASTATFAFTWAGSGRTNQPWSRTQMECRDVTCKNDMTCIASRCYEDALSAWHPITGDGTALNTPYLLRLALGANVKLVVLLRDPVERLHASFWGGDHYLNKYGKTEAGFAAFARESMAAFANCTQAQTRDECVLAFEAWSQKQEDVFYHCDQLAKGAYAVFLRSWLAAFPRGDVLVLRLEDYARRRPAATAADATTAEGGRTGRVGVARALAAVQRHLGLSAPPEAAAAVMVNAAITRGSTPREAHPGRAKPAHIEAGIRAEVAAFYADFDQELEQLLGLPGFADWHSEKSFI